MNQETKQCQNCKKDFVIELEDFNFYEKMKVPAPTFCSDCRLQRRLTFRNERTLYKRLCDLCGKDTITMYDKGSGIVNYCGECWWSDKWDPLSYGQGYDFSRPFLEQFCELMRKVPHQNFFGMYHTLENTNFVNMNHALKNCYYLFNSDYDENCVYSEEIEHSKDCFDSTMLEIVELAYESLNCTKCYQIYYSVDCENSHNIWFSKNLSGCSNCFGCINLRNQQYCIFNEKFSKEDYQNKIAQFDLSSYAAVEEIKKKIAEFWLKFPNKYMHGIKNLNSSGDYISNSKYVNNSFIVTASEYCKYCMWMILGGNKDCYDFTQFGKNVQNTYETMSCGKDINNIIASTTIVAGGRDIFYSIYCNGNNSNLFGCANVRNKSYCILNKQYTKEEYEELVPKIIVHMNEMPYIDKKGRIYKYGEFFPTEISQFSYNETSAQEFFPLTKQEAETRGLSWKEPKEKNYKITLKLQDLPDSSLDVKDDITSQIIECAHKGECNEQCTVAFRIISQELQFYKSQNIPLPRLCPNCRHYQRTKNRNPVKLFPRNCAKCNKEIETSYAPERPEIVYCESCYQQEVV
jgi:hypothetical protein